MTRLPAKALIFAQTISGERNPSPTLFEALNEYRSSLDNKQEANNRAKVLQRHLQKTRSQAKNHKNQRLEHDYIQKMAELDREILQMNSFAQQKAVKRQKEDNMRSKNRAKMHQRQAKNQLQETNSWLYKSSQRKSLENQRTILMQTERDQAEKEIWAMKERIREKRRSSKIADYYLKKIQEVRNQKQREISILKIESKKQSDKINRIISKNTKLRLKNERSVNDYFLKRTYQKEEDASNQHNPQQKSYLSRPFAN